MQVKFVLTLKNAVIDRTHIETFILEWVNDVSVQEIMEMSQKWISAQNFLTERMNGLERVQESTFTIEPLEEKSC